MTIEAPKKRPGRPRSQASEDSILKTTLEILAERGYQGLTIDAVAGEARVSKSTIYRRWTSKEALVLAAFDRTPNLDLPDTGSVEKDLVALLMQFIGVVQSTTLSSVLPILIGACANDPALMEALEPLVIRRREPARQILKRAVARGELASGIPVDIMVDLFAGPVLLRLFFLRGNLRRSAVRELVRTAIQGLKPQSPGCDQSSLSQTHA